MPLAKRIRCAVVRTPSKSRNAKLDVGRPACRAATRTARISPMSRDQRLWPVHAVLMTTVAWIILMTWVIRSPGEDHVATSVIASGGRQPPLAALVHPPEVRHPISGATSTSAPKSVNFPRSVTHWPRSQWGGPFLSSERDADQGFTPAATCASLPPRGSGRMVFRRRRHRHLPVVSPTGPATARPSAGCCLTDSVGWALSPFDDLRRLWRSMSRALRRLVLPAG